jgi:hypothetical protein
MAKKKATPAARAKARRDPAIFRPPPKVKVNREAVVDRLSLRSAGRTYPIGHAVEGDTPWSMGMDQAGQVTLQVRDPIGLLPSLFRDENLLLAEGIRCTVDSVVYVVAGFDHDGEGLYTLQLEDEVKWRLTQFSRFKSASRARTTRYGFIQSFVDEAQRRPLAKMRSFIPEVDDKRPVKRPAKAA